MEWHESEAFWSTLAPVTMFGSTRAQLADTEARLLAVFVPISAHGRILDMACGIGSHALTLARLGFRVTGVDRTVAYLHKARADAHQAGLTVDFVAADMRMFHVRPVFDAVLSLSTSFGFFEHVGDDRQVIENFLHALAPGGILVMDMIGKEILARRFVERDSRTLGEDLRVSVDRRVRSGWSWIEENWTLQRNGDSTQFRMGYRPYSALELASLLNDAGFGDIAVFGGYAGEPYDHNAKRLVVMARSARRC